MEQQMQAVTVQGEVQTIVQQRVVIPVRMDRIRMEIVVYLGV